MVVMSRKILVVLSLLVVSLVTNSFVESKNQNQLFDYFRFDLLWPNSYCNQEVRKCKEPIPQDFKVYALRPYNFSHMHAVFSPTAFTFPLNLSEVRKWNFSQDLAFLWPNLTQGWEGHEQFWQKEWIVHGAKSGMSAENYFYLGVKYAKQYDNIYRSLLELGVVIPSDQLYQRKVLHDEITKIIGSSPLIRCNKYERKKQLWSICICIDINGVAFNCPYQFRKCGSFGGSILFPTKETVSG